MLKGGGGGPTNSFEAVLTQKLEVLAIMSGGGGAQIRFQPFKGGGGCKKVFPRLEGGFSHFVPPSSL